MVTVLVLVAIFAVAVVAGPWWAQSMMRGSSDRSGGPMGVFEEIFHPVVRDAQVALQEHDTRQDAAQGDGEGDGEGEEEDGTEAGVPEVGTPDRPADQT